MDIRTFRAKTMREAIALVRRELGPGAAVLHSREIRRSTVGKMLYGTGVEVTASPELPSSMQPRKILPQQFNNEVELQLSNEDHVNPSKLELNAYTPVNRIKQLDATQPQSQTIEPQPSKPKKTGFPLLDGAPLPKVKLSSSSKHTETSEEIGQPAEKRHQPIFDKLHSRLNEADLSLELVETLCKQAQLDFEEVESLDNDILVEHAVQSLSAQLMIADPIKIEESEDKTTEPMKIALVGPTGVGKTTTVAKLAATLSVTHGYRVGLITLDSFRVAAIEQLKTYANLLGLPVEVVGTTEELEAAMQAMQGLDLVLIDTDGRSPRDQSAIEHMQSLLEQLDVDAVHLVLAASMSQRGMDELVRAFEPVKPTQLLLTKIDESPTLGHIVKTSHDAKLPIGYLTDGQGVPEDLTVADPESLARLILGA